MALFVGNKHIRLKTFSKTFDVCKYIVQKLNTESNKSQMQLPIDKNQNKSEKLSKAMLAFLDRSGVHENMMKEKEIEFEIGKRHLAKMMGLDLNKNEFEQADIDKAIQYLLPSNLFEKSARPFMKSPRLFYPKIKALEFNEDGRPYHHLFYTTRPKYYELLDQVYDKIELLNSLEEDLRKLKKFDEFNTQIDLKNSEWIKEDELAKIIDEKLDEESYLKFINLMGRFIKHPLAQRQRDYIMKFRKEVIPAMDLNYKREFLKDDKGILYQKFEAKQRTARVELKLYEGDGKIEINAPEGKFDITFFKEMKHREHLLSPFKIVDGVNKYDVYLNVNDGGMSCIAKAARFAISNALCSFISVEKIEKLRLAGLLTVDIQLKERKKYGQEGARRKYTWKKR